MSKQKAIQNVNSDVKKWDQVIEKAQTLLNKVEGRAARLKGAIKTFAELRDHGQELNGPQSAMDI